MSADDGIVIALFNNTVRVKLGQAQENLQDNPDFHGFNLEYLKLWFFIDPNREDSPYKTKEFSNYEDAYKHAEWLFNKEKSSGFEPEYGIRSIRVEANFPE